MADFLSRHLGWTDKELAGALDSFGAADVESFAASCLPPDVERAVIAPRGAMGALGADEAAVLAQLRGLAARNHLARPMIGLGYYGTLLPSVLRRGIMENPSWYTAYTPYQPEISQGRLEALLNFQTVVADLTGLPVAGASLLDEATAAAEAMTLARRAAKGGPARFALARDVLPQTRAVLANRAEPLGIDLIDFDPVAGQLPADVFGALVQYPGAAGRIVPLAPLADECHASGALLAVAADPLALALLASPGEQGADIAVGSMQRFGLPLGFGGPHAGYIAVRSGLERQLPGRLVGVSRDAAGKTALRLALQTREQHIRREKATSNICTAQVLLAVLAGMYAVWHGPQGLVEIARHAHDSARRLARSLQAGGYELSEVEYFDTLAVRCPGRAQQVVAAARESDVLLWADSADRVLVSCDETTTEEDLLAVCAAFETALLTGEPDLEGGAPPDCLPASLRRTSTFLTHPVFHSHRSETAMMRYLRRLAGRDFALDRGMIPLGSCTMKLNSAIEVSALTWPGFAQLHPFAPAEHGAGYRELFEQLSGALAELTGYDAVSLQPNAGSQGELAGLLAIRRYHDSRGQEQRTVCLVPASAHGTNAASAVLAGFSVDVVASDEHGDVDLNDLRHKLTAHGDQLGAIMVTYPSTHGVFETGIRELCTLVHDAGGQVYIDGANFNALAGLARLSDLGGDVSHLNLHKTFAIPHGGGGPGVGPVCARSHLAPFLPGHPLAPWGAKDYPVAAAPFGSPSVLSISWAYLRLLGVPGVRRATSVAVLAANYVAQRVAEHFPILFTGPGGRVAHECIVDPRRATKAAGLTVDDLAKRLIDYGFHAPTMSFPVAGTLMVEPTECEPKAELDRFADAMAAIAAECAAVAAGRWPAGDNPLSGAPHTADALIGEWSHSYPRSQAVDPAGTGLADKYFPPVGRIEGAWGDRNLACTCPQPAAFAAPVVPPTSSGAE